jgi:hypothetical protein
MTMGTPEPAASPDPGVQRVMHLVKAKGRLRRWRLQTTDKRVLGELDWRWRLRSGPVTATGAGIEWTFKQAFHGLSGTVGSRSGATLALSGDADSEVARLTWHNGAPKKTYGTLARPGEEPLTLKGPVRLTKGDGQILEGITAWLLVREDEERLMDFSSKPVDGKTADWIGIDVHPGAVNDPDALLLTLFCCHVLQRANAYVKAQSGGTWSESLPI